jgi:iron complex transport system substrate-binding protein
VLAFLCTGVLFAGGKNEEQKIQAPEDAATATAEDKPAWLVEDAVSHITVRDSAGNEVTIPKPVRTTVANGMGALFSTLRALHAERMVLACNEYVSRNGAFFPIISRLPSIGTVDQLDFEKIIALDPDVIFCKPSFYHMFNETIIEEYPVVQVSFETIADIEMLAAILDKSAAAQVYIDWIDDYTDYIDRQISTLTEDQYRRVFIYYGGEYGMAPPPPYGTFGRENPRNALVRRAGGRSITADLAGAWITVDPEWIVEQNPPLIVRECYITSDQPEMGYGVGDRSRGKVLLENIAQQPALAATDAAVNRNVFLIYGDLFEDSWFIGLAYLAKLFHPDLLDDLNPVQMHQEFLTWYQRLDYDVKTQGVFTCLME